ncbi:LOW QUALITY PROTEIN: hypothetical protein L198_07038 [Cryptococcus wingfieldii CBS 7118]|uniref:Uncharacterized protein n=1 Tax=Cryptococcus wingfieldii CBS 7118 TaxID=1295528 RepID=A0A1E3IFM3_9TREE|nr:LOW QUALITY PROTEIN: hypothetical protein L198_07038 [Cryptococcus wingfieldii CBS 7118]ODN87414.1 LOW QUALITY PROTEIN: hypothetical protein L198_07038 [Cryptococcus wingfieldii CBS 7118]
MTSYATLNEDVLPGVHEVQPITAIEFEIPIGHPEATYEIEPGSRDDERFMSVLSCPPPDANAFQAEVTCFHSLSKRSSGEESLIQHKKDVYITKEPMTVISDLTSFKAMFDQAAYETAVNEVFVDSIESVAGSYLFMFFGQYPTIYPAL